MAHLSYIFWNRLKPEPAGETAGLLGADPTVQYVAGYSEDQKTWWRNDLTQSELDAESLYNTRKNPGLPPGPIAAPGRASLEAALTPAAVPYLYFVSRNDGSHVFAETLAQHNANVYQYQVLYFRQQRLDRR